MLCKLKLHFLANTCQIVNQFSTNRMTSLLATSASLPPSLASHAATNCLTIWKIDKFRQLTVWLCTLSPLAAPFPLSCASLHDLQLKLHKYSKICCPALVYLSLPLFPSLCSSSPPRLSHPLRHGVFLHISTKIICTFLANFRNRKSFL